MKNLFFYFLAIFLIVSCSKESTDETYETQKANSQNEIELRSSSESCRNLIKNHDFDQNTCDPGFNAFSGCVDDWECYWGSGDLISSSWDWSANVGDPFWQGIQVSDNIAFMCCGGSSSLHSEGIYQRIIIDPSKSYCLSFDVGSTY